MCPKLFRGVWGHALSENFQSKDAQIGWKWISDNKIPWLFSLTWTFPDISRFSRSLDTLPASFFQPVIFTFFFYVAGLVTVAGELLFRVCFPPGWNFLSKSSRQILVVEVSAVICMTGVQVSKYIYATPTVIFIPRRCMSESPTNVHSRCHW